MATSDGLVGTGLLTREIDGSGSWQGPQSGGIMSGALTGKPTLDFEIHQGCYRKVTVTIGGDGGIPVDITGYRLVWQAIGTDLEKDTQMGTVTILDQVAEPGKCQFEIVKWDTEAVPAGRYFHQLMATDPEGNQDVVMEGFLTLKINVADN